MIITTVNITLFDVAILIFREHNHINVLKFYLKVHYFKLRKGKNLLTFRTNLLFY